MELNNIQDMSYEAELIRYANRATAGFYLFKGTVNLKDSFGTEGFAQMDKTELKMLSFSGDPSIGDDRLFKRHYSVWQQDGELHCHRFMSSQSLEPAQHGLDFKAEEGYTFTGLLNEDDETFYAARFFLLSVDSENSKKAMKAGIVSKSQAFKRWFNDSVRYPLVDNFHAATFPIESNIKMIQQTSASILYGVSSLILLKDLNIVLKFPVKTDEYLSDSDS